MGNCLTMNLGLFVITMKKKKTDVTLSIAITDFLSAKEMKKCSPHTLADYGLTMRRLTEYFSTNPFLSEITARQLTCFLLTIPGCPKTVSNAYTALSSFYSYCVRQEYVSKNIVMEKIEKIKFTDPVIIPFKRAEVESMMASTYLPYDRDPAGERDRAIISMLIDTGVRASELCGMKLQDLRSDSIKVLGKGNKEAFVPMSNDLSQILNDYFKTSRKGTNDFVFQTTRGKPLNRFTLDGILEGLERRSGVKDIYAHKFRHTFAVTFLRFRGDEITLQAILRHVSERTTKKYVELSKDDIWFIHSGASPMKNWDLYNFGRGIETSPTRLTSVRS